MKDRERRIFRLFEVCFYAVFYRRKRLPAARFGTHPGGKAPASAGHAQWRVPLLPGKACERR